MIDAQKVKVVLRLGDDEESTRELRIDEDQFIELRGRCSFLSFTPGDTADCFLVTGFENLTSESEAPACYLAQVLPIFEEILARSASASVRKADFYWECLNLLFSRDFSYLNNFRSFFRKLMRSMMLSSIQCRPYDAALALIFDEIHKYVPLQEVSNQILPLDQQIDAARRRWMFEVARQLNLENEHKAILAETTTLLQNRVQVIHEIKAMRNKFVNHVKRNQLEKAELRQIADLFYAIDQAMYPKD
jgi:hypothetical protein